LITACGIKPIGQWQWLFQAFWLYGAVEPATGEHFFFEFSHVDTECFQRFLDAFAQTFCESINILQLDRGRFHLAKALRVPDNVILLLQPPYCPELNPIERLWEYLKKDLCWESFSDLSELRERVERLLAELTPDVLKSITGYPFILDALSVAGLI
jgi:hypothetical protein